jgi:methionine synthase II (cobalamin-independent)
MQKSDARILTTHVGSLPRSAVLADLLIRQEQGEAIHLADLDQHAETAIRHVVQKQQEAGVDIGNDGEQPRIGIQTYVPQRMKGFGGESKRPTPQDILPLLYQAKVGPFSLEMSNPRHQHEYKVLKKIKAPDDLVLIPGVIDSTTNYIEPAEVVADRICQVVDAVGDRSRVIAGSDCGFGTFAGWEMVAESVVWAKLKACSDGAKLATQRLWG